MYFQTFIRICRCRVEQFILDLLVLLYFVTPVRDFFLS